MDPVTALMISHVENAQLQRRAALASQRREWVDARRAQRAAAFRTGIRARFAARSMPRASACCTA